MLHGLQQGNEVLKEIHKELNIENVERIMEETAEAREYQRVSNIRRYRGFATKRLRRKSTRCSPVHSASRTRRPCKQNCNNSSSRRCAVCHITPGLILMILQLKVSDERPIDLPSVPTEEPATPAKGKIFCETLPLLLTYDALAPEPESRSQETERVPVAA